MGTDVLVAISAIEHHAYCERQCALIHVDGVWSDNEFTVRGTRAHRRVDGGLARQERGRLVLRSIPLWSELHGLTGRADAVEVLRGKVVPVEYKSGHRHGVAADLQVCAQAMCLEEMLGVEIDLGFVWYGATRRRYRVDVGPSLRSTTIDVIASIRETISTGELPLAPNDERCTTCQLEPYCLPDVVARTESVQRFMDQEVFGCGT